VKSLRLALAFALFVLLGIPSLAFAQRISCESRDYRQNYCATGSQVTGAWLAYQRSQSPCIQGQTWGYDTGGIWVNNGCSGEFGYQGFRPSGNTILCDSRDYRQNYCGSGTRISRAWMVEQRSQSPCIEGRTWGWDGGGVWVNQGCSAVFAYQGGGGRPPAPPPNPNSVACGSRDYQYNFCAVGSRLGRAWILEQRSQAPCVEGQTWGRRNNGIWVTQGCNAVFAFDRW